MPTPSHVHNLDLLTETDLDDLGVDDVDDLVTSIHYHAFYHYAHLPVGAADPAFAGSADLHAAWVAIHDRTAVNPDDATHHGAGDHDHGGGSGDTDPGCSRPAAPGAPGNRPG